MGKKLFITCAITGAQTNKALSPFHPTTPEEIASDAVAVAKAGASIVHFHMRDENGLPTIDTNRWVEVISLVRKKLKEAGQDVIINCTASGSKFSEDLRLAHLPAVMPEIASFDAGSMNWHNDYVFLNTPQFLEKLGALTRDLGIKPELEVFDTGMIGNCAHYLKEDLIREPLHYQLMMGVSGGMDASVDNLVHLVKIIKEKTRSALEFRAFLLKTQRKNLASIAKKD